MKAIDLVASIYINLYYIYKLLYTINNEIVMQLILILMIYIIFFHIDIITKGIYERVYTGNIHINFQCINNIMQLSYNVASSEKLKF